MRSSVAETTLLQRTDVGVPHLTLNRPQRRNAIDGELRDALAEALEGAATDAEIREVVVAGQLMASPDASP